MIKDGGPAFPHIAVEGHRDYRPGMPLRDWFAGQAMAGHLACMNPGSIDASFAAKVSHDAYLVADAMLKERAK